MVAVSAEPVIEIVFVTVSASHAKHAHQLHQFSLRFSECVLYRSLSPVGVPLVKVVIELALRAVEQVYGVLDILLLLGLLILAVVLLLIC